MGRHRVEVTGEESEEGRDRFSVVVIRWQLLFGICRLAAP
jgi:hypothetical protein